MNERLRRCGETTVSAETIQAMLRRRFGLEGRALEQLRDYVTRNLTQDGLLSTRGLRWNERTIFKLTPSGIRNP